MKLSEIVTSMGLILWVILSICILYYNNRLMTLTWVATSGVFIILLFSLTIKQEEDKNGRI